MNKRQYTQSELSELSLHMMRLSRWVNHDDAKKICTRLKNEIYKTGGSVQRSEGVKLLKRIRVRLDERMTQCWGDNE